LLESWFIVVLISVQSLELDIVFQMVVFSNSFKEEFQLSLSTIIAALIGMD